MTNSAHPCPLTDQYPSHEQLRARTDAPPGSSWGLFGSQYQLGTLNFLQMGDLAHAARCVHSGQAFSLDVRSDTFASSLAPTRMPLQHNIFSRTPFHRDEWLDRFYTQYGSQLDGLRHIAHPDYGFYNDADGGEFAPGTETLSIHHLAQLPIAGRGLLVDVDRYLRSTGSSLDHTAGQPVSLDTIKETLDHQNTTVCPGDILMIRFGWLDHYRHHSTSAWRENLVTNQVHTGLRQAQDVVEWLWDHRIAMVAADNFAFECWPAQPGSPFLSQAERHGQTDDPHAGIMHRALIGLLGMPIGELWDLDLLAAASAADKRYECLLTVSPLPLVGGVGSPANATALR
jgi:kynurenine formamidase